MSVLDWAGTVIDWRRQLDVLKEDLAPALGRAETRASASAFIDGLLSGAERKTGWMLAEEAGLERPYRIQSLLGPQACAGPSKNALCARRMTSGSTIAKRAPGMAGIAT